MDTFGTRLWAVMDRFGPLCVGLDPSADVLAAWRQPDTVGGLARFTAAAGDLLVGAVGIVKVQVAFYERFGAAGFAVLEDAVPRLRSEGVVVILDAKRNDIGSSVAGYADAYFGNGPLRVDAVTATPYLGAGALNPLVDGALACGGGVFVLARTSNPEGAAIQGATTASGQAVYQAVYEAVAAWNSGAGRSGESAGPDAGGGGLGSVGVVVGATIDGDPDEVARTGGPILAPGVGFQGATVGDLARRLPLASTVPNVSRGVLMAGPDDFLAAVRHEADLCRAAREKALE